VNSTRASEITIIGLTSVAHALAHIYTLAFPAVLLLFKQDFGLSDYHAGFIATLMNFAFGLGSLPTGLLVDRLGSKRMLLAFLMGAGLASVGVSLVRSATGLACALGILGLTCSTYHPAGLAILSRSCRQRGIALGIHGVGGSVGITIAPLLTGAVAACFGWRSAYAVLGGLGLLVALVLWFSRIEEWSSDTAPAHPRDVDEGFSSSSLVLSFVIICFAIIGVSICFQGSSTFLNMHISQQIKEATLDRRVFFGNVYTSLAMGVGILGQALGGYVADRTRREEILMVLASAGTVPFLVLVGLTTGLWTAACAMPYAFFYFSTQPVYNCLISKYSRPRLRGAAFGLTSFMSFGVGSVGATIAGYAATLCGSVRYVFPTMAVPAAASALACATLWWLDARRRACIQRDTSLEASR
jgi:MFS family permease